MSMVETHEIRVRGTVQGVGFRPTVYRIASTDRLVGEVFNDAEGVLIRISANASQLSSFIQKLNLEYPPLAKIDAIECKTVTGKWNFKKFSIRQSEKGVVATNVSADAATCSQCLEELFGTNEPRYLYPFTNCTHCGPRISIVKSIPYDRANSTMDEFPMCEFCKKEYSDPLDRRFHAQPIACFDCGPQISLDVNQVLDKTQSTESKRELSNAQLEKVNDALLDGKIVAIRGIGGFHLCCDATNNKAVEALRSRKLRYAKPFALMSYDLDLVNNYCDLSPVEANQLRNNSAPIVLLNRKENPGPVVQKLSDAIAPGSNLYGFMMPYTPLHWIVCKKFGKPLVMTSGNLSGQPQIINNREARDKLAGVADLILYHNREIANRIDDSVVRSMAGKVRIIRRARGYAPRSFILPRGFESSPQILACGAELKSTFCLLKNGSALVSQHQGDLEDISTFDDYVKNLKLYQSLFDCSPTIIVADKHPEYVSSKFAENELLAQYNDASLIKVQHHHAHIASCMAENDLSIDTAPVLGLALDGLGFGDDGTLWGGEFLLANYTSSQRIARLRPVAMLGGAKAIKEPWRNTYAHIVSAMPWQEFVERYAGLELCEFLHKKPLMVLDRMLAEGLNSPRASSCGRLFDAVAAALGLCREKAMFEGQGAIELEMNMLSTSSSDLARNPITDGYTFSINTLGGDADTDGLLEIDPAPMWRELLDDVMRGEGVQCVATRFHLGLINALFAVIQQLSSKHPFKQVALSGGCLQNKVLLEGLHVRIEGIGLECLIQSQFPSNDGGISLGQAAIAAAQVLKRPH
ncbi:MAG: hydrogenase maturation protein HypF [Arenicella sp.]|jgi:hydrogenase maturation protein HypF